MKTAEIYICQTEFSSSLLLQVFLIRTGGRVIAELCSGACMYANDFVSVEGVPSAMHSDRYSLNFVFSLQAELVDIQYGTVEDLIRIQAITNVTKKIALLKLGQSPLLYKVSQTLVALYLNYLFGFFSVSKYRNKDCPILSQ